VLSGSLKANNR